tara:strand:+ start:352 stop:594 length:243 start_codon:yes stop_codon:yes gene_type:complete
MKKDGKIYYHGLVIGLDGTNPSWVGAAWGNMGRGQPFSRSLKELIAYAELQSNGFEHLIVYKTKDSNTLEFVKHVSDLGN